MPPLSAQELRRIAVAIIGEEAVTRLQDAGIHLASAAAIERFLAEHNASNDRIRACARATMEAAGMMTVRTEIVIQNGAGHLIVTHPAGDEKAMAQLIGETMLACFPPDDGAAWRKTPGDVVDTNDVPIVAATARPDLAAIDMRCEACKSPMRLHSAGPRSGTWTCDHCKPVVVAATEGV